MPEFPESLEIKAIGGTSVAPHKRRIIIDGQDFPWFTVGEATIVPNGAGQGLHHLTLTILVGCDVSVTTERESS